MATHQEAYMKKLSWVVGILCILLASCSRSTSNESVRPVLSEPPAPVVPVAVMPTAPESKPSVEAKPSEPASKPAPIVPSPVVPQTQPVPPPPTKPVEPPLPKEAPQKAMDIPVQTAEKVIPVSSPVTMPPPPSPTTPPASTAEAKELLSNIKVSAESFDPSRGNPATISFDLGRKAKVGLAFYDPDFGLVREIATQGFREPGQNTILWDGKDMDGTVVPDEAYFFVLRVEDEQGKTQVYDPTVFSGGEGHDITEASVDPETYVVTYTLPVMARVLIRFGVHDGPLLKALVDWKPRVKGQITEAWNGKDEDGLIDLADHPRFKILITYFTLPENSVITYGNRNLNYRDYKKSLKENRTVKERPERKDSPISPHSLLLRTEDYAPRLQLTFPNAKQGTDSVSVLQGRANVRVDIDERDKSLFLNQQYEITFFVDTEFHSEQEMGYVPFNLVWNLSDITEGEHIFTVNLSGFKGQIGVISEKVRIVK